MRDDPHGAALGFDLLQYTRSVEESKAINEIEEPTVIISASGMAETGRILHHLRNNVHDPRNTILITSWMAPHTLGRRLVEGVKNIKIFGEKHKVQAQVASINGLSAHAGQNGLLQYATALKERVKGIFLVHGEEGPATAFTELLAQNDMDQVEFPEMGTVFEV
jgi:metallo-beta-lactamase family protein